MLLSMRTSAVRNQDEQVSPATACCLSSGGAVRLLGSGVFFRTPPHCLEAQTGQPLGVLLCYRTGAGETWPMQSTRSRNRARSRRPARSTSRCLQSTAGSLRSCRRRHSGPARCGLTSSWPSVGASTASTITRPKGSQTRLQSVRAAGRKVGQAVQTPVHAWGDATVPITPACAGCLLAHSPADNRLLGVLAAACC